jgi:hypothetical protein
MSDARIQGSSPGTKGTPKSKQSGKSPARAADQAVRGAGKSAPVEAVSLTAVDREALIATAAYFRAEKRSFEAGHEIEDWLAAEAEVDAALLRGL